MTKLTVTSELRPINRREFLNYALGGSLALLAAGSCGAALWFAYPRLRYGVDLFQIDPNAIPDPGSEPVIYPRDDASFWLSSTANGIFAFDPVCPRDGAWYKWLPPNNRFECPWCGSKFRADGAYIEGPAPCNLDQFGILVSTAKGTMRTPAVGSPVSIQEAKVDYREYSQQDSR
jgi:hypothetical protein